MARPRPHHYLRGSRARPSSPQSGQVFSKGHCGKINQKPSPIWVGSFAPSVKVSDPYSSPTPTTARSSEFPSAIPSGTSIRKSCSSPSRACTPTSSSTMARRPISLLAMFCRLDPSPRVPLCATLSTMWVTIVCNMVGMFSNFEKLFLKIVNDFYEINIILEI
ncbi:unnamed protein product, partial [Vitis vinifera]|uniref:Uncharacterized protein n=1 Tax=Vitis vinifera TaxID=29760 RepID=D7SQP1_VITVI